MSLNGNGSILLPNWFLAFLSLLITLVAIAVIPWAASVTRNLNSLSNEMTALRAQFAGQVSLQNEVIRNINRRIEQVELKLDALEERTRNDRP